MNARIQTLGIALLCMGMLGFWSTGLCQQRQYGIFDDYNDLRGVNPLGVLQWGMGGVRTALESQSGTIMYTPAGMAWDVPPLISAEFDIRTPFPRENNYAIAESQTLFLPRWAGMLFPKGSLRFGFGYGVPYGHRRVYQTSSIKYEHTLVEHRIVAPIAWRFAPEWSVGMSIGLSITSWKEEQDGSDTENTATGMGFASAFHMQWKPRPDIVVGMEAQPPITVTGDSEFNSVSFSEEWKRPLEARIGMQKKWPRFRIAADVFFRQYSELDNWMVDRGRMTDDQWGTAVGIECPIAGAKWRFGGQVETDPVIGSDQMAILITTGLGWCLGGMNIQTALIDSHSSPDEYLRATRFLLGFEILAPEPYDND